MTVRSWWNQWNQRRGDAVLPPSPEAQRWTALVGAADWCVTRAYEGGYSGIPRSASVADVQLCAQEDFGLRGVSDEDAAAALRERWYVRRCRADGLVTDAFAHEYCQ
ncbi:hypothetical protein [Streptomyces sp. NBC_01264]|uniref:hypothetical protein n=1 Tax=Streptomyces sp. NBC_01264 TaxID=2903804 RepID=UPI0022563906|nr:hypothetical protein [Streptomyces sp. NBC_01264]MCX4781727.1 hypothetical protein [Streptomyces sp. NBC_01264]